ncbi:MAG: patatin-like phospholipase family protein [Planctomycetota bacterium]
MVTGTRGDLALVMSGGGARAAYQVGLLRALARHRPDFDPQIVTGVSAGAINAAAIAALPGTFGERVERLVELWSGLRAEHVFHAETGVLAANVLRVGMKLVSGGLVKGPDVRSLVDTTPLRSFLVRALSAEPDGSLPGIARRLDMGTLRAVAITAASYSTGQSITFVEGRDVVPWTRAQRKSRATRLRVEHVLASASLPIFFPAVEVDGHWFGDGGMRLTAPLSPAVHLGARRILAISTRYARSIEEADEASVDAYPPPAQVLGVVFNSIFLDQFDADAQTLERVNALLRAEQQARRLTGDGPDEAPDFDPDAAAALCGVSGTNAPLDGLRELALCVQRPSRDLGRMANEHEPDLPGAFRFLTRGLGTKETRSNDMLSLVMFQPDYIARLVELGEKDGAARADELDRFLAGG